MKSKIILCFLFISVFAQAQVADTTIADDMDYSKFGDAEGVKRYATQKILNQTPSRIIGIGYEYQGAFNMPGVPFYPTNLGLRTFNVNSLSGLRAQVNIPVVSNTKIIWQLGVQYWGSNFAIKDAANNPFIKSLGNNGMHSAGINSTIFKPINEKNYFVIQANADINGVFENISDVNSKALTISGVVLYGWKKSEKSMIGVGLSRTYRAGQAIIVPVFQWNKTFTDQWGMELLLPARAHLRYNFSTSNILQLGYELEGNQYWMRTPSPNGQVFIQRGELKPRMMWDKKIKGFIWFHAQAGFRYNWRFDVMNEYDARKDSQLFFRSKLANPFYFNVGLNFVSP
jgi:hypothetical protein